MKYEINKAPIYNRIFSAPMMKMTYAILLFLSIASFLISKSISIMLFCLIPGVLLFIVVFVNLFFKNRMYVKSVELTDKITFVCFEKDKFQKKIELEFKNIQPEYYTLFLDNKRGYKEDYKVLLIKQNGEKIIDIDEKCGWNVKDLKSIYESILKRKELISI